MWCKFPFPRTATSLLSDLTNSLSFFPSFTTDSCHLSSLHLLLASKANTMYFRFMLWQHPTFRYKSLKHCCVTNHSKSEWFKTTLLFAHDSVGQQFVLSLAALYFWSHLGCSLRASWIGWPKVASFTCLTVYVSCWLGNVSSASNSGLSWYQHSKRAHPNTQLSRTPLNLLLNICPKATHVAKPRVGVGGDCTRVWL